MEFAGDPEPVARDEGSIEDDRRAAGVVRDALGLERRLAGAAAEIARLPSAQAQRLGDAPVSRREPRPQQARRDALALGREVAGEAAKLEDVVVDRRRGDEGTEPVTARDEVLALEQLERLAEGHEGHAEALRELALVVEPRTGGKLADPDPLAQRLGDAVVAGHSTEEPHPDAVHRTSVF